MKRRFKSVSSARHILHLNSRDKFSTKFKELGIDKESLESSNSIQLKEKLGLIDNLLNDKNFIQENTYDYFEDEHYEIIDKKDERDNSAIGFSFNISTDLYNLRTYAIELIASKEQKLKIDTITKLVETIDEPDLKKKLENELNALSEDAEKFKEFIKNKNEKTDNIKEELEITKTRLDIFDKKTQIWLKILDRESIASILGGILLVIITISMITAMFLKFEVIKIVESAFLLILGYFFGQSTTKKNNQ